MAALASLPALDWHAGQDRAALVTHNRHLTAMLIEIADQLGLDMVTPRPEAKRGGSVMLRLPDAVPAADVVAGLRTLGIYTDNRSQTLRLSPGVMTTVACTQRLIAALTAVVRP